MKKNPIEQFSSEILKRTRLYKNNKALQGAWQNLHKELVKAKYAYNFFWLGVPVIQLPQDLQAFQEIIWEVKPDLIIETGVAWGGSVIFSASMLEFLGHGKVIGIDVDIRKHNRRAIENHKMHKRINLIEGSSIAPETIEKVYKIAKKCKKIMVFLDSNHIHEHVLAELRAYAPLVSPGSYCVVGDTGIEDLPLGTTSDRPWGRGNNPKTAVWEFLKENKKFKIDKNIESKLILSGSPDGYLKRIK